MGRCPFWFQKICQFERIKETEYRGERCCGLKPRGAEKVEKLKERSKLKLWTMRTIVLDLHPPAHGVAGNRATAGSSERLSILLYSPDSPLTAKQVASVVDKIVLPLKMSFKTMLVSITFIISLRDEVWILKERPPRLKRKAKRKAEQGMVCSMPPISWSNISYYHEQIIPLVKKCKASEQWSTSRDSEVALLSKL